MAVLKVKDPSDPTGQTWLDITGAGPPGPPGPPNRLEDLTDVAVVGSKAHNEVLTWDDGDQLWKSWPPPGERQTAQQLPDPVGINMGASVVVATANTFTDLIVGNLTIDPLRMYQIHAGIRCVQDAGASCNMNITLVINGQGIFDDYLTTTGTEVSLWGAWSQQIIRSGAELNAAAGPVAEDCVLRVKLSVANLAVYLPRITLIDVGPV